MNARHLTLSLVASAGLSACGGGHEHGHGGHGGHAGHGDGHAMPGPAGLDHTPGHRFEDPETWSQAWDDPARDAWQKPDVVLRNLQLDTNSRVADLGAGTGYFSVRLARAVPAGKVFAVDLEASMVGWITERAKKEGLDNLTAVQAAPDDAKLPEPVDVVLVVNTYHHIPDRTAYFAKLRASLKPGGRVAIVDPRPGEDTPGPPQAMRVAPDVVVEEMESAGYTVKARSEAVLPRQYLLLFTPRVEE